MCMAVLVALILLIARATVCEPLFKPGATFSVGATDFLLNGKPFRYIGGSIHYFRIPPPLWNDRLHRVRAAGLNAIQFFVPWNFHEERQGEFNFKGSRDVGRFLELARQNELYALVRMGPYVGGEWENGGLPWWLLKTKDLKMRTRDPRFLKFVQKWYDALLNQIGPHLLKNGGNVLMLQVENEYGQYWTCDHVYTDWIRDTLWKGVGTDVVLYTTDQPHEKSISCGTVAGVFPTIDFAPRSNRSRVDELFGLHRRMYPYGPYVNSELYPGYLVKWGQDRPHNPSTGQVIDTSDYIYKRYNASLVYYVIHGGTNFEFWVGSQTDSSEITSYDYTAPITEEGDVTPKYVVIRNWIKSLPNWTHPPLTLPKNSTKKAYGTVLLTHLGSITELRGKITSQCFKSVDPLSFEDMDVPYGYVLYETQLRYGGSQLTIPQAKDYSFVFLDGDLKGVLVDSFYNSAIRSLVINARAGQILSIVVENRGRISYDTINDFKGILSKVLLDQRFVIGWTQCAIDPRKADPRLAHPSYSDASKGGNIFVGHFPALVQADTFLDSRGWGKGQVYINGFNIGRYWKAGPQQTLYIPSCLLRPNNTIVVMELLGTNKCFKSTCFVNLVDRPAFEYASPDRTKPFDPPYFFRFGRK